jgi:GTPase SAR1 family protein
MRTGKPISKIIITLGDNETGKSSILNRFTYDKFDEDYIETIGKYKLKSSC